MKLNIAGIALGMLFVAVPSVTAQTTAIPAAPAAATTAGPQVVTVWQKLGITHENCAKCRAQFCKSGIGRMTKAMMSPMVGLAGGLIGPCCPDVPTAAELAALANGAGSPAEAAAAKIKADEAGAAARRLAVRYLGTVDCHYYPEAEEGIIAALRADRNECVRLEAAMVLGSGCCCTRKTIAALTIVVSGSDKDGNPSETSERVKWAASNALHRCISFPIVTPTPTEPPEAPPAAARKSSDNVIQQTAYALATGNDPLLQQAQRYYAEKVSAPRPMGAPVQTGQRNLMQIMRFASQSPAKQVETPLVQMPNPAPLSQSAPLRPLGATPADHTPPATILADPYR